MKSFSVFRSAFNTVRNRYSMLTVTSLVLLAGACIYYFYFLTLRSENLDKRQYRILNRIESQLRINLEGYENLAIGQTKAALAKIIEDCRRSDEVSKLSDTAKLNEKLRERLSDVSFLKDAKIDSRNLIVTGGKVETKDLRKLDAPKVTAHHSAIDSLFSIHVTQPRTINKVALPNAVGLDFTLSIGSILRPLLRPGLFEGYMVLHGDSVVYETVSSGLQKFLADTLQGELNTGGSMSSVRHAIINGQDYRVYQVGFSTESETGWTIIGLKSADKFASERRTIPRPYLFGVFMLVIFIVLSVPFIKSMIMSRTERLGTTDVIFSAVSLALGTSVVSILLLDGYLRMDRDELEQGNQLKDLSGQVETNLATECNRIVSELETYTAFVKRKENNKERREKVDKIRLTDSLQNFRYKDEPVKYDSLHKRDSALYARVEQLIKGIDSVKYEVKYYSNFSNLFVVDTFGNTEYDRFDPGLSFNVSRRKYISAPRNGECMMMPGVHAPMYLDAIVSWREQQFRGAVSTPVNDSSLRKYEAAVITASLRSITAPVIPLGTGFCIFDKTGTVLFHSDSTRSLNENLLEECGESADLEAALVGRTEASLNIEYSGTRCKLYVRPLKNLPYFIATFSERDPVEAIHGQVFGMAFILQILLFSFYVCVILFGLILLKRNSRLRSASVDLSVFAPDINGTGRYIGALLFNIFHGILLLFAACFLQGSLTVILLFFIAAPYTVFLNLIQLSGYTLSDFITGDHRKMFRVYAVAILVANGIAFYYASNVWILPLIQVATLCIYLVVENIRSIRRLNGWYTKLLSINNYRKTYSRLIFVFVMLTCVLPAVSFAILTYNKEKEIAVKTAQLQMMNKLNSTDYNNDLRKDSLNRLSLYITPFYGTFLSSDSSTRTRPDYYALHYDYFTALMRQLIQNSGEDYNHLQFGASDSLWQWSYTNGNTLVMDGKEGERCKPDYNYQLSSTVSFFSLPIWSGPDNFSAVRFWLCLLGAIVALYLVLRFFTSKIFVHERYSRTRSLKFDEDFLKTTDPGYKAFVTGMPSAGKTAYFTDITQGQPNVHFIDFVKDDPDHWMAVLDIAVQPGTGIIIIDHFEHDILNVELTRVKLELIERLVAVKHKKVIIISSIQPSVFTHLLEEEREPAEEMKEAELLHERWNRVLAAFYVFTFPLQGYAGRRRSIAAQYKHDNNLTELSVPRKLVELVESECNNGTFLRTIGLELLDELHNRPAVQVGMDKLEKWKEREDLIIRTQKLAETYYRSLWNHLAIEEQFVLHDLAQDGLVNPRNLDIVEELIDKGIIVYTNRLRIMNRSFRNFILCVVGPTDLGRIDQQVRASGAWSKLKGPLFLIICALILFVMKSDRSQLFGYFTAFVAIIPVVVSLFGLFGQGNKKE